MFFFSQFPCCCRIGGGGGLQRGFCWILKASLVSFRISKPCFKSFQCFYCQTFPFVVVRLMWFAKMTFTQIESLMNSSWCQAEKLKITNIRQGCTFHHAKCKSLQNDRDGVNNAFIDDFGVAGKERPGKSQDHMHQSTIQLSKYNCAVSILDSFSTKKVAY